MVKLNKEELRKELIRIYKSFILNPKNEELIIRMIELDKKYSGAINHFLESDLAEAISMLGYLVQKELPDGKDKIIEARRVLSMIKK